MIWLKNFLVWNNFKLTEELWRQYKEPLYISFIQFLLMPVFSPRSKSGSHIAFNCHVSLVFSHLWQLLRNLSFHDFNIFEGYWSDICRMSLNLAISDIFSLLIWKYEFWGKTLHGEVPFSSHHIRHMCMLSHFCCVWRFVTLWTVAPQTPLSMEFSRQEHRRGFPCPSLEDLPDPVIKPSSLISLALAGGFFTTSATWKAPCIRDNMILIWLVTGNVNSDSLVKVVFARLFHYKDTAFPFLTPSVRCASLSLADSWGDGN